jgi:putative transposase
MLRATKIKLSPTTEQQEKLAHQFGCARWVWNYMLNLKSTAYKERKENLSGYTLKSLLPKLKEENPWLKDADSQAIQEVVLNLDKAYKNFFAKRTRYPRFKKKYGKQSYAYPQRVKINQEDSSIYLPKIGWVKCVLHRKLEGKIKTVTISKTHTGKYFASILIDDGKEQTKPLKHFTEVTGVDVGLTHLVSTDKGEIVENPRFLKAAYRNIRTKQKKLSRTKKGSHNRTKTRLLVAKAHERLANARNDFQHKLSKRLADENQAVIVETLNIKGMLKHKKLSKHISDAGWYGLLTKLDYKLQDVGGRLVKIDRWFPSSKTCSCCGEVQKSMGLDVRIWTCPSCSEQHHRDINAAKNIRKQGIIALKAEGLTVSAS